MKNQNHIKFKQNKQAFTLGGKCGLRFKKASLVLGDWGKCGLRFRRRTFTLAEVLIVLGIIGVVAAMTLPTIMQKAQEQSLVSGLLKFNTELQQAINLWKNDIDCHDSAGRCLADQDLADGEIHNFDQIANEMKIIKRCYISNCSSANWLPDNTLNYYGNNDNSVYGKVAKTGNGNGAFLLADGITFSIDVDPAGFDITVDVNGMKKPNRMGKDTFKIMVGDQPAASIFCSPKDICYNNSYVDSYSNGTGLCREIYGAVCNPNNTDPTKDNGAMPTSYVLINHKLPDFKELSKTVAGFNP